MNENPKPIKDKKLNKKILATIVVLVLFIIGAGTGIFLSLNSFNTLKEQRDELNKKLADLESNSNQLRSQSQDLTSQLQEANDELKKIYDEANEAKSAVLTISVSGTTKDSRGYVHQTNTNVQDIIVDLSVKNESKSELYLSLDSFKLKDSQNQTYSPLASSCWPPAANKAFLKPQLIAPGESVSGSICYGTLSVFLSGFKLQYGEKTFDLSPKDATYATWL